MRHRLYWFIHLRADGHREGDETRLRSKREHAAWSIYLYNKLYTYVALSMSMSKTFMGGAVCPEFELEASAVEEMLDCVVCSGEQFSFQTCLESGDGSGTFRN